MTVFQTFWAVLWLGFVGLPGFGGDIALAGSSSGKQKAPLVFEVTPLDLSARTEPSETADKSVAARNGKNAPVSTNHGEVSADTPVESPFQSAAEPVHTISDADFAVPTPTIRPQFTESPSEVDLLKQRAVELRDQRVELTRRHRALKSEETELRQEIETALHQLNQTAQELLERARVVAAAAKNNAEPVASETDVDQPIGLTTAGVNRVDQALPD